MLRLRFNAARPLPWLVAVLLAMWPLLGGVAVGAPMETLSSGVGKDNRAAHPEYPLKLVFAVSSGAYLANVNVVVQDAQGQEVLRTTSTGPWLFVKLPPGDYRVRAERQDGTTASAKFDVTAEGQSVVRLIWKGKG